MATYVSPGVYTIEKDISEYTPSINTSVVGIVGFAPKGPTNKATLITSQNQLLRTFGEPSEALTGQALEGALEVLETTNQLYFIRAADSTTATDASATMSMGVCPAVIVSGSPTAAGMALNGWGVKRSTTTGSSQFGGAITFRIQSYDNDGTAQFTDNNSAGRDFSVPEGTSETSQAAALKQIIGGDLDSDKVGVVVGPGSLTAGLNLSGAIVGSFAGSGASLGISACSGTSYDPDNGVSALVAVSSTLNAEADYGVSGLLASAVRVYGASYLATGSNSVAYEVESLHPGAGYNAGTRTDGTTSGNSVTVSQFGGQNMSVVINQDGTAQETFKASLVGSGAFIEDVINTGATNLTSDIIKGNIIVDDQPTTAVAGTTWFSNMATIAGTTGLQMTTQFLEPATNPTGTGTAVVNSLEVANGGIWNKLLQATATSLAGGNNGVGTGDDTANALIGNAAVEPKTGMQVLDDPVLNVGFALVPGVQTESVQNALITLASTSQNFMALVSPPYGIGTVSDAIAWTNGQSTSTAGSRSSAINNSYAAVHWPWVKVFSTFDGKDRWYDPSIFAARQFAYTDAVADSWFAPAGFQRGKLSKPTEVEVKLNQGDRDSLYSGGNCINPIVNFPQQGITIFGQRTSQRAATALDRINVRRLMIYIRKVIVNSCQRFVFEPNDTFTWSQVEGLVNPFLDDIRRRRGITEFRVVCDETTNTPVRIDRGEMWTKVIVKPTKTAEILIFEINLTNQSADLGTL
tara:strand:- start:33998 stop:36241 length:2244 start_codon:yes stop_codon:yes gene_type:complete